MKRVGLVFLVLLCICTTAVIVVQMSRGPQELPAPVASASGSMSTPEPKPSASVDPNAVLVDTSGWSQVTDLQQVVGLWSERGVGKLSIWQRKEEPVEHRAISIYPWRLEFKLEEFDQPISCGFYPKTHAEDPQKPESGLWRAAWCEGANLPTGDGLTALKLGLVYQAAPERISIAVGPKYHAGLSRKSK